jgi:hypothetical protein
MKRATIYKRKGAFFVHASSQTTEEVWILAEPCLKVEDDAGDGALGDAIAAALRGSRVGVAHPTSWGGLFAPILALAGVKSWGTFAKSAKCAEVEADGAAIRVIPMRTIDRGFEPDQSSAVVVDGSASTSLGAAARQALS